MSYEFKNKALQNYLTRRQGFTLPAYCQRAALELGEQVRGYNFEETEADGRIHVSMFEHTLTEICSFVDWSVEIWNQTMRSVHRSRKLTTEEFIANHQLRDGDTPLESLLILFGGWHEISESDEGPYVSLKTYSSSVVSDEPFATVGNLCAAVGLAVLDRLTTQPNLTASDAALYELGIAWEFAVLARWNNHMEMGAHFATESSRERMVRAARARHSKDPKQEVKRQVHALWQQWEKLPSSYPSAAAFARDMCDKWPNLLASEVVVSRWVRDWRKASRK